MEIDTREDAIAELRALYCLTVRTLDRNLAVVVYRRGDMV